MHVETSVLLAAWAMHLSNRANTSELLAAHVPTRTLQTIAMSSARAQHTTPAMACPVFVAPRLLARVSAMMPRIRPTSPATRASGNRTNEITATRLATPMTSAATPSPLRGRRDAVGGGGGGPDCSC